MKRFILIGPLIFFIFTIPLWAHAKAGTAKSKANIVPFSTTPFDLNLKVLPSNFYGNNPFHITISMLEEKLNRNEFETTAEYNKRLDELKKKPIAPDLTLGSMLSFRITNCEIKYDADKQILIVKKDLGHVYDKDLEEKLEIILPPGGKFLYHPSICNAASIDFHTSLESSRKYLGSNAFGVKKKITCKLFRTLALAFSNIREYEPDGEFKDITTMAINLPVEEAKSAKAYGNILIIGQLKSPYMGYGVNSSTATISDPNEFVDKINYLVIDPAEIWFYNSKTGKIYYKKKILNPLEHSISNQEEISNQ